MGRISQKKIKNEEQLKLVNDELEKIGKSISTLTLNLFNLNFYIKKEKITGVDLFKIKLKLGILNKILEQLEGDSCKRT